MVGMYPYTTFDRNPTAASIDTPLHSYIPYAHVDHMHPVAVIALATAKDGPALTREVYGDDVIWTDWQRPGFELGLELERVCREHPNAKGAILGQHGLINADFVRRVAALARLKLDEARLPELTEQFGRILELVGHVAQIEVPTGDGALLPPLTIADLRAGMDAQAN